MKELVKCNYCTINELIVDAKKAGFTIRFNPIVSGVLTGWYEVYRSDAEDPITYMCGISRRCSCRRKTSVELTT